MYRYAQSTLAHLIYVVCYIQRTEAHPSSRRLQLNAFLSSPTTRAGRYSLLLEAILKRTPDNHPDREAIPKVMEIIKGILDRMNHTAGETKNKFDLRRIHANLRFKNQSDHIVSWIYKSNGRWRLDVCAWDGRLSLVILFFAQDTLKTTHAVIRTYTYWTLQEGLSKRIDCRNHPVVAQLNIK